MEYLVTYGWALLVLFVVLAYLLTSGAFSSNSFSTQECIFQPDLPCSPFILYKSGGSTILKFELTDGLGFPIEVYSVNYTVAGLGSSTRQTYQSSGYYDQPINPGQKFSFEHAFSGSTQPSPRDFRNIDVALAYMNCRANPCTGPYVVSGRISTAVEEG